MGIADLSNVLSIFRGKDQGAGQEALYKEVLLMTLARATSADAAIAAVEISTVQKILKEKTGDSFSDADIRLASRPALYQEAPFNKYLASVRKKLGPVQRAGIIQALAEVIGSDTELSALEIDFFNMVAESLAATPAEIAGLVR